MAVTKHGNGYRAVVYNPATKKQAVSRIYPKKTDAKKAEVKLIRQIEVTTDPETRLTMQMAYDLWLQTVQNNVAERTLEAYHYNWKRYCAPLKDMVVQRMQPIDIVKWRISLEQKYMPETVNKGFSLVSMVLAYCRDVLRIIEISPAEHVPRAKVKQVIHPTWTEDQIKSFLNYIKDTAYYAPIALCCVTGMRPGECCGLMEKDLKKDGSITLRQGRNARGTVTEMKTERSHRTIRLSPGMAALLQDYIDQKRRFGYKEEELFITVINEPLRPDVLSRNFRALLRSYNKHHEEQLPEIRLYDIRHSFATNLLTYGAKSKLVSEVMGNSVNTMEHHYVHLRETMHEAMLQDYADKLF